MRSSVCVTIRTRYRPTYWPNCYTATDHMGACPGAGWIRWLDPTPSAYTLWRGERLKLFGARVEQTADRPASPGTALGQIEGRLEIACGQGAISVKELQLAGHKRLPADAFLRGQPLLGQVLG